MSPRRAMVCKRGSRARRERPKRLAIDADETAPSRAFNAMSTTTAMANMLVRGNKDMRELRIVHRQSMRSRCHSHHMRDGEGWRERRSYSACDGDDKSNDLFALRILHVHGA